MQVIFLGAFAIFVQLTTAYYLPATNTTIADEGISYTTLEVLETSTPLQAVETTSLAIATSLPASNETSTTLQVTSIQVSNETSTALPATETGVIATKITNSTEDVATISSILQAVETASSELTNGTSPSEETSSLVQATETYSNIAEASSVGDIAEISSVFQATETITIPFDASSTLDFADSSAVPSTEVTEALIAPALTSASEAEITSLPIFLAAGIVEGAQTVDTSKTVSCTQSSNTIAAKAIETPPCSTTSKPVKAVTEATLTKPCSSKVTAITFGLATGETCVTHTICHKSVVTTHINGNKTATLKATAKALSMHSTNATHTSKLRAACTAVFVPSSNITLPSFPLSANTTSNLSAFLNLILSVPEAVFAKGDADVSAFFSGLGSCLASGGKGLEADLSGLAAPISSFITGAGKDLLTGIENGVKDAGKDAAQKGKEIGKGITDKLGSIFHKRDSAAFASLLSDVESIAACMSNVASVSAAFDVAKCAVDIGLLALPVGRLGKIRNLIGAAGGVVKVVKDLKEGSSAKTVALDSLKVLEEVIGVAGAIKACGVVVDDVKKIVG